MQTKTKIIVIVINILLLIFATTFTYMKNTKKNQNNTTNDIQGSYSTIDAIYKKYDLNGITIDGITLYTDEDGSMFTAKMINSSDRDLEILHLIIRFYDKNDDLIIEEYVLYDTKIEKDNIQYINMSGPVELRETKDIKFEIEYK